MRVEFEIGGRSVDPEDLADYVMAEILKAVEAELRAKIGSIRRPETGEFPVLVVRGNTMENLSVEVTGSPELIALVHERLNGREEKGTNGEVEKPGGSPVAFLCHASEDKNLVRRLAGDLVGRGIDVFFDEWEIRSGDSIRRKIETGLEGCTHFIAIMTPDSISKEWVNTEIDAGFIRKTEGSSKFIPLRFGLPVDKLPPLLRSLYSPSMDDYESGLAQLVSDIHGISRKPETGPPPSTTMERKAGVGVSAGAETILRLMIEGSEHGDSMDPELSPQEIRQLTRLTDDDIVDAVSELEGQGFVQRHIGLGCGEIGFHVLTPEAELFVKFDRHYKPWNPEADACRIAADLVNRMKEGASVPDLAASYEWPPRRMNPAVNYLLNRRLIEASETMGCHPWTTHWIGRTAATRRFLRDRT
ncbi:MAG: toll/interleukin-1 receptor domain-containing protein [Desulfobacteraceae bacterium]|jgi:DNA-binding MarR family transcriptional regulator|nr:MAG: toll/interleukin-1 receptor domain-containing protein [Desulfobacteraceae bacterium]